MRRFLRFGPRFLLRWRGPEDQTDVTSAKLTISWTHALPNTGQIQLSCYGVPHPTLFGRYMCLTPCAAAAHYCTALSSLGGIGDAPPLSPSGHVCLGELIFLEERRGRGTTRRRHKTTNGLCLMVENAAFEQGQKRRTTDAAHRQYMPRI